MDKVYKICSRIGCDAEFGFNKRVFKSKEIAESKLANLAAERHCKNPLNEDSDEVQKIYKYWHGDYGLSELIGMYKNRYQYEKALKSALYYDFIHMFWIEEYQIDE